MRSALRRSDGQTLVPWGNGKYLAWDAIVVDTVATSHIAGTSLRFGSAASEAEDRNYRDIGSQYTFVPLGFETFGSWGPEVIALVADIGRELMEENRKCLTSFF